MLQRFKNNGLIISIIITYLLTGCISAPTFENDALSTGESTDETAAIWDTLPGWHEENMQEVWDVYQANCQVLIKRANWKDNCRVAQQVDTQNAHAIRAYFQKYFYPQLLKDPEQRNIGVITGYYEPILKGSRQRQGNFQTALYRYPAGVKKGSVLPARAELLRSNLLTGQELVYVDNPVEAAFLQIQGSGRIQLEEGGELPVTFAGSNEQPFKSIARWLLDQRKITPAQATMQGIKAWAQAHPEQREALLNANPRFIFFRELPKDSRTNAPGALGVPLTPQRSLAVDPSYIPLGSLVFLSTTWPMSTKPLQRLMFAQDTGSAIKGKIRADFYWGVGPEAGEFAGRMRQPGQLWVLLPRKIP